MASRHPIARNAEMLGWKFNPSSAVSTFLNERRNKGATIRRVSQGHFELTLSDKWDDVDHLTASLWVGNDITAGQLQAVVSGVNTDGPFMKIGVFTGWNVATSGVVSSSFADSESTDVVVSLGGFFARRS